MDLNLFQSVATQLFSGDRVEVNGQKFPVRRTSAQRLRAVTFTIGDKGYTAIEQNPEKPSRWGELARAGHKVVQFKDESSNRFIAVAIDGKVKEYGKLPRK